MIACLNQPCDKVGTTRGVCQNCYKRLIYNVKQGKTTWAKLEKSGKILPSTDNKHFLWRVLTMSVEDRQGF